MTTAKEADLAGPGIGDYAELERVLPDAYEAQLSPKETMQALYGAKRLIEDRLCEELNLTLVQVPLIVDAGSGVNDNLDRDGSRTPVTFHISNDRRRASGRGPGHPGSDEVEANGARAVRDGPRRGPPHRHASGAQGLLPRPRSQRVRRPVGLGAGDHPGRRGRSTTSPTRCARSGRCSRRPRASCTNASPRSRPPTATARRAHFHPRGGDPRGLPGLAAQAARDGDAPGVPGGCSSTGSAGRSLTAIRTSCEPRTTTTGRPRRPRRTGGRCTA